MTDKMIRFLSSIHLDEEISSFDDLEFEAVVRNRFKENDWNMSIRKENPWTYDLLNHFLENASQYITEYTYTFRFSYVNQPTANDTTDILLDWYQSIYRVPLPYDLEVTDSKTIKITFNSDDQASVGEKVLTDFRDFLSMIGYDNIEVVSDVEVPLQDASEVYKPREIKKIQREALNAASEAIEESKDDRDVLDRKVAEEEVLKEIEEQHALETASLENNLMKEMQENAEEMRRDRERARLNRHGNYQAVDFIDAIDANSGNIDVSAKVFSNEIREFAGSKRFTVGLYDVHDGNFGAIYATGKVGGSIKDETINNLLKGVNARIRGVTYFDEYSKQLQIRVHYVDLLPPDPPREDHSEYKRVELHLHSLMSAQDGVSSMDKYCKTAKAMGHSAIAITDHGVVQGFPDAQAAAKKNDIKMLYGSELYMVDDQEVYVFNPTDVQLANASYVVLDLETTGLSSFYDRIMEFGAVKVNRGLIVSRLDMLIDPEVVIDEKITNLTHITQDMVNGKPTISEAIDKILDFIGDSVLVTHNASFDFGFLQEALKRLNRPILRNPVIDTLALSHYMFPEARAHNLGALCKRMEVDYDSESAHRADYDAEVLNNVWQQMLSQLIEHNQKLTHKELNDLKTPKALLKHIRPYHVVVIAKNSKGLKDLYKLISLSHVDYLAEVPKVPRKELEKYRENLYVGSACFNGEVFQTARYYNFERLKQVVSFYDYIEVQPPENYSFLINTNDLKDEDELHRYLNDIIRAADELHIPVCATGDCHYCDPEDKKFRDVYISSQAVGGAFHALNPYNRRNGKLPKFENPDQHFRSTDEMMEAFKFLGDEKKIFEIVVLNTNLIADGCDEIVPLPNDHLYTPSIENCENKLTDLCFDTAKKIYGDPLPEFIQNRLETELNGIISNGYSVIYYFAHLIVKKANEDGYIVGSRGSVGSSLVATMSGITEVNPLPPYYLCPHCHHLEWTSETLPDIKSGYDLPSKKCPECGTEMVHDGQNIPFETFLGFHADKTPDIDLNFPGDYQARAHEYTKELLGEDNVFRAGTIETVAEKTAFGFARGYIEREGYDLATYPKAKIAYLASGCVDVKRTTGQHPGGIVVIPSDHDVYDFTPIQYPADDVDSNWKTTHFDFHSIHDTILKFDLLGHVDPMALKMMTDLTGVDLNSIPMNDPKALSLFSSPKALKLHRNYLNQSTGAMGIPEFGTEFVRGILEKTRPQTFSELVIISGLSHGTNVWHGNAETLVSSGTASLKEVIGCRDDIMTYLISMKLPADVSFAIMEDVRKGRGLKPEYVEIMKLHNVPDYYIDSCNKIKYMFPKGHATAYVMMAIRVGYFKVYYPLEFYATFFSVRSKQYDIQTMIKGESAIIDRLEDLKRRSRAGEKLSPKEEEISKTLQMAIEMCERGYSFSNVDLYKSDAVKFTPDHEHKCLIPPFITIDGLGENAAVSVVEARKDGEFTSQEDLLRRTKLNSTNVENLEKMGSLKGLSKTDQLSLFDF